MPRPAPTERDADLRRYFGPYAGLTLLFAGSMLTLFGMWSAQWHERRLKERDDQRVEAVALVEQAFRYSSQVEADADLLHDAEASESDALLGLRLAKYEAAYRAWMDAEPRIRALSLVYLDSAADTVVAANTARYTEVLESGRGIQYRRTLALRSAVALAPPTSGRRPPLSRRKALMLDRLNARDRDEIRAMVVSSQRSLEEGRRRSAELHDALLVAARSGPVEAPSGGLEMSPMFALSGFTLAFAYGRGWLPSPVILVVGVAVLAVCAIVAGVMAGKKRRYRMTWVGASIVFGPLALIALLLLPDNSLR